MEESDSDIDTSYKDTDETNKSLSDSAEGYVMNNEEPHVNAEGQRSDVSKL
jgi:hypothetical protein